MLADKRVLITGGTGSIGTILVRRLLGGELGLPREIIVFSRDEAKQYAMRLAIEQGASGEATYRERQRVSFHIGDVANYASVVAALRRADIVFHAAALKQVPTAEFFPSEAIRTNVAGAENIVRAIREHGLPVETVVGISTDKACKPVNVMGMTKALQERIFVQANLHRATTRFVVARYGNVLASRGSVIPLFHKQVAAGGPVTVTTPEMTRFLMSLDQAVDTILAALVQAHPGEVFVPRIPSARMTDVAAALIGARPIDVRFVGIRPGEKTHEILVSEEEALRTVRRDDYYAIAPMAPELQPKTDDPPYGECAYRSADHLLSHAGVVDLLRRHGLLLDDSPVFLDDLLSKS
ncbi:MAG TPA: polysaccharide biosynthesis protein [Thermomicrobiales bacterium]|nr:polysaccharide biosynthesis protein [Thermomicrobiales bacterium]